jgi:hypothetical protein
VSSLLVLSKSSTDWFDSLEVPKLLLLPLLLLLLMPRLSDVKDKDSRQRRSVEPLRWGDGGVLVAARRSSKGDEDYVQES